MLKALDLTINSLGSGSVVGKKGKKRTQFLSLFPQCGAWSQAKPLTTVTLFSVLLIIIFWGAHQYKKEGLLAESVFFHSSCAWSSISSSFVLILVLIPVLNLFTFLHS